MATAATTLSVAPISGRAVPPVRLFSHRPHTLAKTAMTTTTFVSSWKMGLNPLQRGCAKSKAVPARKFLVRAARTESQGVSLGFRAPSFELPEPLTGKIWKLEDFEPYPALLDGPEFIAEEAKIFNYPFPYLYDEFQEVARDFGAV